MDKYFVIGHPVKHSLSPEIHKMFAAQFDIEMSYETRDFEPGGFIEGMAVLRREDHPKGANVTHPFKMDAYQYCDEVTPRARKCEAVNTLIFDGNRVLGDTTDGKGFVTDVSQRCGASLTGARVLIWGQAEPDEDWRLLFRKKGAHASISPTARLRRLIPPVLRLAVHRAVSWI